MRSFVMVGLVVFGQVGCSGDEGGGGSGDGDGDGDGTSSDNGTPMNGDGDSTGGTTGGSPQEPGGMGTTEPEAPSEPNGATCADTDDWDSAWAQLEQDVLDAVNVERSQGATCGGREFGPADPLVMDPALQCASRLHSKDMADRDFFDHDNPSGEDPWVRIDAAGFSGAAGGENIAAGRGSGEETVAQWMDSSGHCSNIMNPDFEFIGVGYYPGGSYGHLWTQTFGSTSYR